MIRAQPFGLSTSSCHITASTFNHSHSNFSSFPLFLPFYHLLYMDKVTMVYKFYSMAFEALYVLFVGYVWVKG